MNNGLSEAQAREKIIKYGYNNLQVEEKKYFWEILFDIIREPMILLLVIASVIYLFLGDKSEAIMLSSSIIVIIAITLFQERRTQKSLQALKKLSAPMASVIREGEVRRISALEIVCDDVIIIEEGDRVPADAQILSAFDLRIDESLLTGESIAVEKNINQEIYAGTLVVAGHASAKITAIGLKTKMGQIGITLGQLKEEKTILQKQVSKIITTTAIIGFLLCILLVVTYYLTRGNLLEGILAGIALAMGILPEEFAVVLTIFIAIGAWQLAKKNVLARQMATVETLGKANVLCFDKTGTLTLNKMSIVEIAYKDKIATGKNIIDAIDVIEYGILASKEQTIDPIEVAFKQTYLSLIGKEYKNELSLVKEYAIDEKSITFVRVYKNNQILAAAKGAPEDVAELCHINKDDFNKLNLQIESMAKKGLKILAVAKQKAPLEKIPDNRHDIEFEFLGLVGFADPLKPESKYAIARCYDAGVRVMLITGDYPITAANIAEQIGLRNIENISGVQLDEMTKAEIKEKVKITNVFSRVSPDQKLIIINALRENGDVVAMIGDGTNDAPALKAADIGVSMGKKGTEVAREASDIVLLDDNFSSVVEGIGLGRNIYNNLKKAINYIITFHIPIAGLALLPAVFNLPLILLPAHIVFLELIVDPTCTLVFQAENNVATLMKAPPIKNNDTLLGGFAFLRNLITGLIILGVTFLIYVFSLHAGISNEKARAITFLSLIFANLTLMITVRSWPKSLFSNIFKNRISYFVLFYTLALLSAIFYFSRMRSLFQIDKLTINEVLLASISIIFTIVIFSIFRLFNHKIKNKIFTQ